MEHAVHPNWATFILYYFQVFVQLQPFGDSSYIYFLSMFFMWVQKDYWVVSSLKQQRFYLFSSSSPLLSSPLLSSTLWSIYIFNLYLYPPHPSHHSSTSLFLQLLAAATTQGRLVSSSPRGGPATTKTPLVVSGSLRLSREAPSKSALTGLYDSAATTQP